MKMLLKMLLLLLSFCFFTGCIQPGQFETLTDAINVSVDSQQENTNNLLEAVKVSGTVNAETLAKIEEKTTKSNELIDISQIAATEAAKVYEKRLAEGSLVAGIEAARAANATLAPVNPYAGLVDAGLGIVASLAVAYGVKKRKDLNTVNADLTTVSSKYKAHTRAVEGIMRDADSEHAADIYNRVGLERDKLYL